MASWTHTAVSSRTQGFDEYYGILYSNDMRPVQLVQNEQVTEYPVVQATLTQRYTERALDFINRNREHPFFLYLPHAMPHKPLAASQDFYRWGGSAQDLYAAVVRELDWSVGRILEGLKQAGIEGDTMVVFTSDNGPSYGGSTGGLRGMKHRIWEGGIRVPMIARWPGRIPAGVVASGICSLTDLFPTLCARAGVRLPAGRTIDGKDVWNLMTHAGASSPHEAVFAMADGRLLAVRSGKWKLLVGDPQWRAFSDAPPAGVGMGVRAPDGVTILAPFEQATSSLYPGVAGGCEPEAAMLFDLEEDPAEQRNVAKFHPDIVTRLREILDAAKHEAPALQPPKGDAIPSPYLKGGRLKYDDFRLRIE